MPRGVYKRKKARYTEEALDTIVEKIRESDMPEYKPEFDPTMHQQEHEFDKPTETVSVAESITITRGWCDKCQHGHDLVDGECTR